MDWTIALFGYWKYNWVLFETEHDVPVARFVDAPVYDSKTGGWTVDKQFMPSSVYDLREATGNEKRAVPGDIVAFKPASKGWTELEKKHFLITKLSGPDIYQMRAMCEPEWDLTTYEKYAPLTKEEYKTNLYLTALKYKDPDGFKTMVDKDIDKLYDKYLLSCKARCEKPRYHWKKRRFNITQTELQTSGVDVEQMLDKKVLYEPSASLVLDKVQFYDKLKQRNIDESDSLNEIVPLTVEEMLNLPDAEETLTELRS